MDGKKGGYLVVLVFRKREEVGGQAKWSCRCIMPWRLERRGHQSSLMYNGWRGRLVAMWYTLNLLRTLKIWLIEREREQQEVPVNGSSFLKDICQRKRSLDLRLSSLPICATAQWPPPYRSLHSFSSSIFKSLTPSFSPSIEALTTSSCWLIFFPLLDPFWRQTKDGGWTAPRVQGFLCENSSSVGSQTGTTNARLFDDDNDRGWSVDARPRSRPIAVESQPISNVKFAVCKNPRSLPRISSSSNITTTSQGWQFGNFIICCLWRRWWWWW